MPHSSSFENIANSPSSERVATLLESGLEAYSQSKLEQALELLQGAAQAATLEGQWNLQAQALVAQGKVYRDLGEAKEALDCLDKALELACDHADTATEGSALNQRAGVNHSLGEYALALKDLTRSLELASEQHDDRRIANTLINMGILSTKLADYPRALAMFSEAHQRITALQNPTLEGECFVNLALLYEDMGDDTKALETQQLALQTVSGLENRVLEAIITVNMGYTQHRLQHFSKAAESFEAALVLARDIKFAKVEIAALDGLGQTQANLGNLARALELHHEAFERSKQIGDGEREIDALLSLSRDYLAANAYVEAMTSLVSVLELAHKTGRKKAIIEAHELLATVYEQTGDLANALKHFRDYHRLEKDLFNEEREQKTRQLSIQFDVERARYEAEVYRIRTDIEREARERAEATVKERTLELVESNTTIEQQRQALQDKVTELHGLLEQNETLRQRLVLAAKRNTTLNERFLRRLSAELHDGPAQDLGFALIKLDSGEIDKATRTLPAEQRASYSKELETVYSSLARALNEMRAIASGMSLPELEHLSLSETIKRAARSHQRRTLSEVTVDVADIKEAPLPVKITLYRLVQESLMNSFKHAGGKEQQVKLFEQAGQLRLEVSDQGPGFVVKERLEQQGQLGLVGMRERVESLGGEFWVSSTLGRGTTINATLFLHGVNTANETKIISTR